MREHDNGGPAFPVSTRPEELDGGYGHQDSPSTYQFGGMSLRDYFAAKALTGLLAAEGVENGYFDDDRHLAARAYEVADAMLAARQEGQS